MVRTLVIKKRFKHWSSNVQEQLKSLTFGPYNGSMHHTISDNPDLMTFVCWRNSEILGWAVYIHKQHLYGYKEAWFYVRPQNRRQGIADRIMTRVLRYRKSIVVHPHEYKSKAFFKKMRKRFGENKIVY